MAVSAPPEEVWPWLVQVGYRRGGWYADDLLDNFGRPSAREILPEFQNLHLGQHLAWGPRASERSAFRVDGFVGPLASASYGIHCRKSAPPRGGLERWRQESSQRAQSHTAGACPKVTCRVS